MRDADHVCNAVRDCWVSLYSTPAMTYRARLERPGEPAMGVAVQLMVDAGVSGVLFTCNPVSGDPSMIAVNASWGLGLAVVGGEVTPDDYLVSKVTREVVREHIHAKDVQYVPDPAGRGAVREDVPEARREVSSPRPPRRWLRSWTSAGVSSATSAAIRTSSGRSQGGRSSPRACSSSSRDRSRRCRSATRRPGPSPGSRS